MAPRKGASRKAGGGANKGGNRAKTRSLRSKAGVASASGSGEQSAESESEGYNEGLAQESQTPSHQSSANGMAGTPYGRGKSPYVRGTPRTPSVMGGVKAATRQILTPLFGRKYARGAVDMPMTPRRGTAGVVGTPVDGMRLGAVAKTPYTARRGIADYSAERDPIRTYVRLKPADSSLFGDAAPKSLLQVVSDKEVEIVRGMGDDELSERYLFAGVFPTLARQPRVFEVCAVPVISDLFAGYNTLLFSYGITNSGKTYTVQGNSQMPGLLPRSIKSILDVLDANGAQGDYSIRPKYATQVEYCSDPRVTTPTFRSAPGEDAWVRALEADGGSGDAKVAEMARQLKEDGSEEGWVYQLYVSYFEVYNEMIYDLLDLDTLTTVHVKQAAGAGGKRGRGKQRGGRRRGADDSEDPLRMSAAQIAGRARTALLLRSEGGRGNEAFVDGLVEVRVRSVRDVVRVLQHGQLRRAVHATGLNGGSSRSHALFQAKLVRLPASAALATGGAAAAATAAAAQASVRTLTVVDLAGSERAKRTGTRGERLAEAGKINASLMTLKKCLDVRRFNASSEGEDAPQLVPYNESKVTRLFQPALDGGAKTVMVVCIDPYEHAVDADASRALPETKNVLDFARVASELVTRVRRVDDVPRGETLLAGADDGMEIVAEAEAPLSDDEIFFDSAAAPPLKRRSPPQAADVGVQTEGEATSKRQRVGLGGDWQHAPAPDAAAPTPTHAPARGVAVQAPASTAPPADWAIARNPHFTFALSPGQDTRQEPLQLTQALTQDSGQRLEVDRLRAQLDAAHARLADGQTRDAEIDELATYADALEAALGELRRKYAAAQERALNIEAETRRETAAFFMAKLAQVQAAAGERLQDERALAEAKAAHKIDILTRVRVAHNSADDVSDGEYAAEVPTVSPRTAVRRAVSRAASKKANKLASVSAGEDRELHNLRKLVELQESQAASQQTQLEMLTQARSADRNRYDVLEAALNEANARAAALDARLLRATSARSRDADLAITRAHEQERAELLAQITLLKNQLREAEAHALGARRQWESQELLPVQERLRVMVCDAAAKRSSSDADAAETLQRAERDRDDAWAWWTREQQRNTQLCAQNDVLMREIRRLRANQPPETRSPPVLEPVVHSESGSDDDSFCKVSLRSVDSLSAINGGNPLGAALHDIPSQPSILSPDRPLASLDRALSKGRLLHRNHNPRSFARDSSDSVADSSPGAVKRDGRAKRVVSKVFNFTPNARRRADAKPYMAGRFANTDTAVGNYSREVFSFEDARDRGNTLESLDSSDSRLPQSRVRSVVYSGPLIKHATGGFSVTFNSEEVHELPLSADAIPEQPEDEVSDQPPAHSSGSRSPSPPSSKRTREMMHRATDSDQEMALLPEDADPSAVELDSQFPTSEPEPSNAVASSMSSAQSNSAGLMEIPSMASLQSTVKKKRKLHGARTITDIESPENILDDRIVGAPEPRSLASSTTQPFPDQTTPSSTAAAWPPSASRTPLAHHHNPLQGSRLRTAKAAQPQESKQPVLFTPVRTRSKGRLDTATDAGSPTDHHNQLLDPDHPHAHGKQESIFTTPMKMLNRLRHRKK
ncbi:hypothetical protein H4R20_003518 [Coemansia guatemalensis]|uniref:Kinesin motor domain-containing protein n=1 Tax=Coemansia guatemalensis TaxID=2761395 RepID=A0A9W8LSL1_9FUNG|nr:hypothetical protein H4R20_003518 [Coemansia guatemalensis]